MKVIMATKDNFTVLTDVTMVKYSAPAGWRPKFEVDIYNQGKKAISFQGDAEAGPSVRKAITNAMSTGENAVMQLSVGRITFIPK